MILTGKEIIKQVKLGRIHIKPFIKKNVGPNSYDFRLGRTLKVYKEMILDPHHKNPYQEITLPKKGYLLMPNHLYLGCTVEEIGSDYFVPMIQARSSTSRLGLSISFNSGLGDLGFKRQWTLMLNAIQPLKIYPGMPLGQILFLEPMGEISFYKGHYRNAKGPTTSAVWKT